MVGKTLSHYRILEELGRGGMGIVYKAEDTKLDRTVAIKVLPSAALSSEDDRARFYREAKAAAQLHHPNIASVFEIDEAVPEGSKDDDLRPFISMEYIEGETLSERIKKGPLKLEEAVRIASQIASGLEAAHEKDIVHRDLKSQNVMLTNKGEAKILDFGLAQTAASTKLTRMGSTVGTVAFMSPEQARGEEVDRRTDLWSLGVVLYEMISGRSPFPGDYEQAVVYEILNTDPEPLTAVRTGVPMQLEWVVSKCLAKLVENRYQTATDLLVDLRNVDASNVKMSHVSQVASGYKPVALEENAKDPATQPSSTTSNVRFTAGLMVFVLGLVLGYMGHAFLFAETPDPEPVVRAQLVLPDAASPLQAAITPDDRLLYYASIDTTTGVRHLSTYDFVTGRRTHIAGTDGAHRPVISQDGRWVAYTHQGSYQLWKMSTSGGEPTEIIGAIAPNTRSLGSFTPDGDLLFGLQGWNTIDLAGADGRLRTIAERDTVRMQQYILAMQTAPTGAFFTWSDFDGSGIPYRSWILREGEREADVLLDGAYIHTITASGHALFMRGNINAPEQTLAVPIDLETGKITGVEVPLGRFSFPMAVSPSGLLVYEDISQTAWEDRASTLFRVHAAGETDSLLTFPGSISNHFTIAGDGSSLTVNTNAGMTDLLLLMNLGSGASNPVSREGSHNVSSWAEDDTYIYFDTNVQEDGYTVFRRKADLSGVNEQVQIGITDVRDVHVSPDGSLMVFKHEDDIWAYSFDGDSTFAIAEEEDRLDNPILSPDKRFVSYIRRGPCGSVQVKAMDGQSEPIEVASSACHADWTADGRYIYYQDGASVYRLPISTNPTFRQLGPRESVYTGPSFLAGGALRFDLTTDGTLYVAYADRPDVALAGTIWVVNNWFEELNRIAPRAD